MIDFQIFDPEVMSFLKLEFLQRSRFYSTAFGSLLKSGGGSPRYAYRYSLKWIEVKHCVSMMFHDELRCVRTILTDIYNGLLIGVGPQ